ncbi:MAG: hypothetical protein KKD44_10610 [Proteobacteria bacterium]|nr:hypothetical protein [Pseudomonadota bacterium]
MSGPGQKKTLQLIWAFLLFGAGLAMFITIPGRVREIQEAGRYIFGLKFGLYVISVFLMIGGGKKIYDHRNSSEKSGSEP